ncbi:hypothetical protein [Methanolapillus millepedarum]|uniref:Uncharacterized protein n=1 Tax=Methanolapillus millepedarum TaxID=3028296 RepID=A0AA96ZUP2_9EURY|nr:hypothetical protein MsAc7_14130 [Methanosarcinaceae archaeon Ac7]
MESTSLILFFLMTVFPGIYLATTNFLYTPIKKYDFFIIRAFLTAPLFSGLNVLISGVIVILFARIFPEITLQITGIFGEAAISLAPLFVSLIFIILLKIFVISTDESDVFDSESELYVYYPRRKLSGGKFNGTKFEIVNKYRKENELLIEKQITDLIIRSAELEDRNLTLTNFGEMVATLSGLSVLNNKNISGFYTRNVIKYEEKVHKQNETGQKCFQLVSTSLMPPVLSPPTIIQRKKYPVGAFVYRLQFYYHQTVMKNVSDLNQTEEYFGNIMNNPYPVQRFWIITKRARDIFIQELGQDEYDFFPVRLVDDDGNIIQESGVSKD